MTDKRNPTGRRIERSSERRAIALPARLTWKDASGAVRFISVMTRDVSDAGVFVECEAGAAIPLYRLVHLQVERSTRRDASRCRRGCAKAACCRRCGAWRRAGGRRARRRATRCASWSDAAGRRAVARWPPLEAAIAGLAPACSSSAPGPARVDRTAPPVRWPAPRARAWPSGRRAAAARRTTRVRSSSVFPAASDARTASACHASVSRKRARCARGAADGAEVREEQRHRLPRVDGVEALLPRGQVDVGRRRRRHQVIAAHANAAGVADIRHARRLVEVADVVLGVAGRIGDAQRRARRGDPLAALQRRARWRPAPGRNAPHSVSIWSPYSRVALASSFAGSIMCGAPRSCT